MEITLPIYLAGLLSSVLTEAAKFFPFIGNNDVVKSIVAIALCAVGGFVVVGKFDFDTVLNVLVFAFLNYKFIIQPVSKGVGLRTQE